MNSTTLARVFPPLLLTLTLVLVGCASSADNRSGARITLQKSTYAPGENIVVNFSNGPANTNDWIAIYTEGKSTDGGDNDPNLKVWYYTNGTHEAGEEGASEGRVLFDSASENSENIEADWPLTDGNYDIYFICCDGYDVLAGPAHLTIDSAERD